MTRAAFSRSSQEVLTSPQKLDGLNLIGSVTLLHPALQHTSQASSYVIVDTLSNGVALIDACGNVFLMLKSGPGGSMISVNVRSGYCLHLGHPVVIKQVAAQNAGVCPLPETE